MADYEKTIEDNYGDTAKVEGAPGLGNVYVLVRVPGSVADLALTPKKARRLAKALKKAAKRVERERG